MSTRWARIDGQVRLIEGLALPSEEVESSLSYYNTPGRVFTGSFRFEPRGKGVERDLELGCAYADVHQAQGCKEAVGKRAGRHFPGGAIREIVRGYDPLPRTSIHCATGDNAGPMEIKKTGRPFEPPGLVTAIAAAI